MARVVLLGRLRDVAGWREKFIDAASVSALRDALAEDAVLAEALSAPGVQVAVNKALVRGDEPLASNDEVAFLPPMSGG